MVRWALEDSARSTRIMNFLSLSPALVGHMVEWVQSPAKAQFSLHMIFNFRPKLQTVPLFGETNPRTIHG
jgi:hypothetical protein